MKQKLYKLCSVLLVMSILFSVCVCTVGTASAESATYYVSPNGDDASDGITPNTPKATVNGAIAAANIIYGKGDKVSIKLIKDNEKANYIGADTNKFTAHKFLLSISTYNAVADKDIALLGNTTGIVLGGPTFFEKVRINIGNSNFPSFVTDGYDLTFGSKVSFSSSLWDFVLTNEYNKEFNDNININLKRAINKKFVFGIWGQPIINGNLNFTLNNNGDNKIKLGANYRSESRINGNVNINIGCEATLDLEVGNNIYGNGASIQIINSSDSSLEQAKSEVADLKNVSGGTVPHYFIKNSTGKSNGVEFTGARGKFKINFDTELYDIYLNGKKADIKSGYLYLTKSGDYTVTAVAKEGKEAVYYVKNGAKSGDGKLETPYGTISQAIDAAKALGFSKADTLNVKLLDDIVLEALPEYSFNLKIESASQKAKISVGNNPIVNGTTVYKNVILNGRKLNFTGKTVVLEKDVDFNGTIIDATDANVVINAKLDNVAINTADNINLVINNEDTKANIKLSADSYENVKLNIKAATSVKFNGSIVSTGDVEVIFNNSAEIMGISYNSIKSGGEKWYIENTTGRSDGIDFTDIPGEYSYKDGWKVELVGEDDIYESKSYLVSAPAGSYIFRTKLRHQSIKNINDEQISEWRELTDNKIEEILNTPNKSIPSGAKVYYVSNTGSDYNSGLSPDAPLRTLDAVNNLSLTSGSYVCFKRGDLWRGQIVAKTGVTYTAYGTGEKPKLYRSPFNGAKASLWKQTENPNVWAVKLDENDVGTIVFNEGEEHAIKILIRTESDGSTYNNTTGEPFEKGTDLTRDLHFYHDYKGDGTLYLYSKENPGNRFDSIEFNSKLNAVHVRCSDVTVDNLCIKYVGSHGVGAGTVKNLTVTNCEFGWIGGSIQTENNNKNIPTRFGNAVEIYGGCNGFNVSDNYIYQVYDAGITQQVSVSESTTDIKNQKNITYARNVIEYCNYSIEYWISGCPEANPSRMENFIIEDNYMWYAGLGFPEQRPDGYNGSHINSWYGPNRNRATNFIIKNNLMLYSKDILVKIHSSLKNPDGTDSMPEMSGNHYLTEMGSLFGLVSQYDTILQYYDEKIPYYLDDKSTNETYWFIDTNHEHWYDNDCDSSCNECYELRTLKGHIYDSCEDTDCNECGYVREADHIYDNACDADCNSCGEPRTPEDHVYDGPTDTDCNVCGDVRVIADGFIKESGVYYYYENGVKSNATTLVKVNGSWFYLEEGAWTKTTAIVKYNGVYFYVYKGKWNSKTTDLIKYKGSWFYIKNGKWTKTTDLVKKNGVYFLVKNGKWSTALTTLYKKSGKWFSIKNGKWDKTTQIITYSGKKFYCKGGFAQLGFSGKVKIGSKTYTVVKGQIK